MKPNNIITLIILTSFIITSCSIPQETHKNNIILSVDSSDSDYEVLKTFSQYAHELDDLSTLVKAMKLNSHILLGESTHGTKEFYKIRSDITKSLIEEGFNFILLEGDWNTIYQLNKFVKNMDNSPKTAEEAIRKIERWPTWMWRNKEIKNLIIWLREYNDGKENNQKIGIYGMDLYGAEEAINAILRETSNHQINQEFQELYICFGSALQNFEIYAQMVSNGENCQDSAEKALKIASEYKQDPENSEKSRLIVKQNALIVRNAERFFRKMVHNQNSWNARAIHFFHTLQELIDYYGENSKSISWAHNTHMGDARATEMVERQQYNLGQIARENLDNVFILGFGTKRGNVTAARQWGAEEQIMRISNPRGDSFEALFSKIKTDPVLFIFDTKDEKTMTSRPLDNNIMQEKGHRAIGVVYNPTMDRFHNYVDTILPERYNAFIFIRETSAISSIK